MEVPRSSDFYAPLWWFIDNFLILVMSIDSLPAAKRLSILPNDVEVLRISMSRQKGARKVSFLNLPRDFLASSLHHPHLGRYLVRLATQTNQS
jgi:hypothetical protein